MKNLHQVKGFLLMVLLAFVPVACVYASGLSGYPANLNVSSLVAKNNSALTSQLTAINTTGLGLQIKLVGDGATPNKYLINNGGMFKIANNGGSSIFSIDDSGAVVYSSSVTSTKPCATGFSRSGPNYCQRNNMAVLVAQEAWTSAAACTARSPASVTLPADAKYVDIDLTAQSFSNGIVSNKTNSIYFYTTAACTAGTVAEKYFTSDLEIVAIATGTALFTHHIRVRAPLVIANTFYTTTVYANVDGVVHYNGYDVAGYGD